MVSLVLAKPMPQCGYAVPAGNGRNDDCAGSDGNIHSDVQACPENQEPLASSSLIDHGRETIATAVLLVVA